MTDLVARLRSAKPNTNFGSTLSASDAWQAAAVIAALREGMAVLEGAATTFLAKLDHCAPNVADAFMHRQLRCGEYSGPDYVEELKAFRAILAHPKPGNLQKAQNAAEATSLRKVQTSPAHPGER